MAEHKLVALNDEVLDRTAHDWRNQAGVEEFEVELSALFEACRTNHGFAQALVNSETGKTGALLEVVDTPFGKDGAVSKLLKVWVSPEYWASNNPDRKQLIEVYLWAYLQVISSGMYNRRDTVKIYGRTDLMLDVLHSLKDVWNTDVNTNWTASIAGRWLVLMKD